MQDEVEKAEKKQGTLNGISIDYSHSILIYVQLTKKRDAA
jgi:hypothetical protein